LIAVPRSIKGNQVEPKKQVASELRWCGRDHQTDQSAREKLMARQPGMAPTFRNMTPIKRKRLAYNGL